ncbi:flagellar protein FlaG [Collimonas sp.]|uniref:flagellar protein FlaG n=1 Tax=Collimonas sp. TaxID=1963772 RepID=UPI002CD2B78F|nr:flagellar protein FlaG [Collimonas sp.]HWW08202.1 flagellar protein FlaG [Collimonas sp.]
MAIDGISAINAPAVEASVGLNIAAGGDKQVAGQTTAADGAVRHAGVAALGDKLAAVPERSQIQSQIDALNRQLQLKAVSVQFQIDPGYKDVILKVVDQQDGKVVLQIPSEEVVRIAKVMGQLKGVLLEKTA